MVAGPVAPESSGPSMAGYGLKFWYCESDLYSSAVKRERKKKGEIFNLMLRQDEILFTLPPICQL
jgi:hypothetical protein